MPPRPFLKSCVTAVLLILVVSQASLIQGQVFEVSSQTPFLRFRSASFDLVFSIDQISGALEQTCGFHLVLS